MGTTTAQTRTPLSLIVLAMGCVAMGAALLAILFGVPSSLVYDVGSQGIQNQNSSHEMLAMSNSIDNNIKFIKEATDSDADSYNGYLSAINTAEEALPELAKGVDALTGSVVRLNDSLANVKKTTKAMNGDLAQMAEISERTGVSMLALEGDMTSLSGSLKALRGSTEQLQGAMKSLQTGAHRIATQRTNKALQLTKRLNTALPDGVPTAQTSESPVVAQ